MKKQHFDSFFLEKILHDLEYTVNDRNLLLLESVLSQNTQDINYIWTKVPSLLEKIKHVKGFLSISNSKYKIKISFDKEHVSSEISKEFYEIIDRWAKKYSISLEYDFEKEAFYIN